ncbi:hypothetical protein AK812_SmicGene36923 [Symbiodinium microadriaticum]|uniref:C2 domain-containing protein n=1 Tax=Symbiodinium microadriaticum TaxID=2951 RepID=A0A1Q9CHL0_SYMMI|nr:hypothetical protein AK812_SmicGene36923 [Symbiodinium microadriaticum]
MKVRVADDEWESSCAVGCNPTWLESDSHCFWYYDLRQTVHLEVLDQGRFNPKHSLAIAKPVLVNLAAENSGKPVELFAPAASLDEMSDESCGTLEIECELLQPKAGVRPSCELCMLRIKVDEIYVPQDFPQPVAFLARCGNSEKTSPFVVPKVQPGSQDSSFKLPLDRQPVALPTECVLHLLVKKEDLSTHALELEIINRKPREEANPGARSKDSAMASLSAAMNFEHGDGDEDYLLNGNESYATNHRHFQELQRLSAFQQVTTKVPPSYDGRSSWFAYEDAIDDWCDITELDGDKRGPALRLPRDATLAGEGVKCQAKMELQISGLDPPNNRVRRALPRMNTVIDRDKPRCGCTYCKLKCESWYLLVFSGNALLEGAACLIASLSGFILIFFMAVFGPRHKYQELPSGADEGDDEMHHAPETVYEGGDTTRSSKVPKSWAVWAPTEFLNSTSEIPEPIVTAIALIIANTTSITTITAITAITATTTSTTIAFVALMSSIVGISIMISPSIIILFSITIIIIIIITITILMTTTPTTTAARFRTESGSNYPSPSKEVTPTRAFTKRRGACQAAAPTRGLDYEGLKFRGGWTLLLVGAASQCHGRRSATARAAGGVLPNSKQALQSLRQWRKKQLTADETKDLGP